MPTPSKAPQQPDPPPAPTELEDLRERVDRLEQALDGLLTGKVAEISQEERDRRILSRLPNSYPEAVEHEAAKRRQAERDKERAKDGGDKPAEGDRG